MTTLVLGDLILESLTPGVNAPLSTMEGGHFPNICWYKNLNSFFKKNLNLNYLKFNTIIVGSLI
jgi:hypothetical protein